ncbi:MAG: TIGR02206 family membrane protein [Verrucomicrobia bacterium]|nr:TIGR02206 family membrane protein [Verrucomicrobiota bacterium]
MDHTPFHIFGPSHWAVLAASLIAGWCAVRILRRGTERWKLIVRVVLAVMLFLAVMADPAITYLRHVHEDPALARKLVHETAWPFFLCDWAAIACGIALLGKNQRLAELGWCWGLGGTLNGLIYPSSLSFDWKSPDWYAFFAEHAGVPIAGAALVFGLGLRPQAGVVWRAWFWMLAYFAVAIVVNLLLIHVGGYQDANYGFTCTSAYSPFGVLGPWPIYLVVKILLLAVVFAILTVPICGRSALRFQWG